MPRSRVSEISREKSTPGKKRLGQRSAILQPLRECIAEAERGRDEARGESRRAPA